MRGSWVVRDGVLVPKHMAAPLLPRGPRAGFPAPYLNRDGMDPLMSMADGKLYESKSAMRRAYRELGYEELGNDAPRAVVDAPPIEAKDDLIEAYKMVRDGYKPPPLETDSEIMPQAEVVI